ncbi:MAG: endonuclease [Bacteroidota bacterium]
MLRFVFAVCLCCCFACLSAQISMTPAQINFSVKISGEVDSTLVTIANNSPITFSATDVELFHGDAFWVTDTAFSISPGNSHDLWLYVNPRHNIRYIDYLLIRSNTHPDGLSSLVFTLGKYANGYYDATQNLWHEDLKGILSTLISFGTTDLGYTNARDQMYLFIDNQAQNGQGASQNTIECIYTGTQAVGYVNRQDAQTNYNFNTEHTFPQALFGSTPPMFSDLHHLFPVTASANSERSNNPFGVVANPSWTNGGSKSNGNTFEPRDAHKGRAARALFYFVLRYQDYQGFVAPQENILRQWALTFAPTAVEQNRNDEIFARQNNRNPFIDHPFLERISSITGTAGFDFTPRAHFVQQEMNFGSTPVNVPVEGQFILSNQGWGDLTITNISFSNSDFGLSTALLSVIPHDSVRTVRVRFVPTTANGTFSGTMTVSTDDPDHPTIVVNLAGESTFVGRDAAADPGVEAFPNPATEALVVRFSPISEPVWVQLSGLDGRIVREMEVLENSSRVTLPVAELPRGVYLLHWRSATHAMTKKIVLE